MEFVRSWIEGSAYAAELGLELAEQSEGVAQVGLPFADPITNGDGVLHGGCAASVAAVGAQAVTRAALGEESGPWHTAALHVSYLSAAKQQGIVGEARLLRPGKNLCFCQVDVRGDDGRPIAHATAVVHARFGEEPATLARAVGDHGESDPGPMGGFIGRVPFIGGRGIRVEHMTAGTSRLVMPWRDGNADASGGVHEGALLSLLDTAGAMASWAVTGPGRFRAGTPAMQAQILAPPTKQDLVAYGHNAQRDGDLFFSDVEVAGAADGHIFARGTVFYRLSA